MGKDGALDFGFGGCIIILFYVWDEGWRGYFKIIPPEKFEKIKNPNKTAQKMKNFFKKSIVFLKIAAIIQITPHTLPQIKNPTGFWTMGKG